MSEYYWHRKLSSGTRGRVARATIYDPRTIFYIVLLIFGVKSTIANPLPAPAAMEIPQFLIPEFNQSSTTVESLLYNNTSNSTTNDLYVIRAVVYEIGILTDVDNSTNETTGRHEEINLSFYDPPHKENGLIDLSGIPVPQVIAETTNISRDK